jgi:hypothetical protein
MKQQFDAKLRLNKANKERLNVINNILENYVAQGFTLTLRQLYYQLVSRDIVANKVEEYKKLSVLLGKGRMAGVVDWSSIEDRTRQPQRPYWVQDIPDAISDLIGQYRLNRMRGQLQNVEVWIEKDALSSVFKRVTEKYHIHLMVNRGYSSISAMYEASNRLKNDDVILYFGDHDPSGLDMVRDIADRLDGFGKSVTVWPIALTTEQVRLYNPPENPAKLKDPRSAEYVQNFGLSSWELDALEPSVLIQMCEDAILSVIDLPKWEAMVSQEQKDILTLKRKFRLGGESEEE